MKANHNYLPFFLFMTMRYFQSLKEELADVATVAKFAIVQNEGARTCKRISLGKICLHCISLIPTSLLLT